MPILAINLVTADIALPSTQIDQIRTATQQDSTLQRLSGFIYNGYPVKRNKFPRDLHDYWNYKDDLSIENGIVLKSHRIIIPSSMKSQILHTIHAGHFGIEKCLLRARETVFWPGITQDIKDTVDRCSTCQATAVAQRKLPLIHSDVPPCVWHTLGTDLFHWKQQDFIVVADYYSKYILVRKLPSLHTHSVLKELELMICEFGRPHIIRSDNGTCYSSREFKEFTNRHGIEHITSSPHHHQSNGFAEAMVKISKNVMEKAHREGKAWNTALLEYRCTPLSSTMACPLEIMLGRTPRTGLPQMPSRFNMQSDNTKEHLLQKQNRVQDSGYHPNRLDFEPGQPVWVKLPTEKGWTTGVIDQPARELLSHWVKMCNTGSVVRRTEVFLKPRNSPTNGELHAEGQLELPLVISSPMSSPEVELSNDKNIPVVSTTQQKPVASTASRSTDRNPVPAPTQLRRTSSRSTKGIAPDRFVANYINQYWPEELI